MHQFYSLLTGPFLYAAFILCIGGIIVQTILLLVDAYRKERSVFSFISLKYTLLSMIHWATPFGSTVMRKNAVLTVVGFLFHFFLLAVPVFLFAHVLLVYEAWGIAWPALPGLIADAGSLIVSAACVFFLIRRVALKELRFISGPMDYIIPVLVFVPFFTGFWASQSLPGFKIIHFVHIISGEILLVIIPFTRLSHMFFGVFTRIHTSSEFGGTRFAKDW